MINGRVREKKTSQRKMKYSKQRKSNPKTKRQYTQKQTNKKISMAKKTEDCKKKKIVTLNEKKYENVKKKYRRLRRSKKVEK